MTEAEKLAKLFHDTYEKLAPKYGYKTREDSAKPWSQVPENNKKLMITTCAEVLKRQESELKEEIESLYAELAGESI